MVLTTPCRPQVTPSVAEVCRRINEISTLPHIALRVMEVAADPNSDIREIKRIMETDAALSMRVLRCANSSAYATRTKINNLQQAISVLGIKLIRNLAMTASVRQMFANEKTIGTYSHKQLWHHLAAVGICARMIALRLRFAEFDDIFLAGLLHDTGIIFEEEYAADGFVAVIQSLDQDQTLRETEHARLGFDHTELGEGVAKTWKFPAEVTDAIRFHHDSGAYRGENARTVQCVELANFLCSLARRTSVGVHLVRFPQTAVDALFLTKDDLVALATDLESELARNEALLQF